MNTEAIGSNQDLWLALLNSQLTKNSSTTETATTADATAADVVKETGKTDFRQLLLTQLDADGDGKVSEEEFQSGLQDTQKLLQTLSHPSDRMCACRGQGESEAAGMSFAKVDVDGDGAISPEEYAAIAAHKPMPPQEEESSFSLKDKLSIPGLMGSLGDLMAFTGRGQGSGNIAPYNMLMDQLLGR